MTGLGNCHGTVLAPRTRGSIGHNHWCNLNLDVREKDFVEGRENDSCEAVRVETRSGARSRRAGPVRFKPVPRQGDRTSDHGRNPP